MWILDGYNLLFRWKGLQGSLEQRRRRLLESLRARYPLKELIVVFDGRLPPPEEGPSCLGNLRIFYTCRGVTADEFILDYLERVPNRSCYRVVTADRALARMAGQMGARVESPEKWIRDLSRDPPALPQLRLPRPSLEYLSIFEERWRLAQDALRHPRDGLE